MMEKTGQERKIQFLSELDDVRMDTIKIISQPQFFKKSARIIAGLKSYTRNCSPCKLDGNLKCSEVCYLGENQSCRNLFWHPPTDDTATKKDFEKALEYLEYLIPILQDMPEFCYSESMISSLREFIETTDSIFKTKYLKPKKKIYKNSDYVKYERVSDNKIF